ncbi:proteoglycan 4b isoform X2 [Astyanax mexicanus]|uniref:proteoglycan 4b isoform X2 n=1 Tax=Astyanax mexicanus TaxID=7994 RepID=UPI0020CADCA4|nr:proteoglycan 4b isoform X2 [Astyanax mexicanus]
MCSNLCQRLLRKEKGEKRSVLSEGFFLLRLPDHYKCYTNGLIGPDKAESEGITPQSCLIKAPIASVIYYRERQRRREQDTAEMNSASLFLLLACVLFTFSSAQKSCRGQCGEAYNRGDKCHCDFECLSHNECCKNYESVCTTRDSCKGRCGERFKRGRQCHCDIECFKFNQCCPDYETQCTLEDTALKPQQSTADSPQRTSSLRVNSQCNKLAEEETDYPEVTTDSNTQTSPAEEDYGPEEEGNVPTEKVMDPTETEPSPIPTVGEIELSDSVKATPEPVETEESSSPLTDELSTPEATMNIPSIIPPATEAPTETTGNNDPPVPEKDPESSQDTSESEPLPSNSPTSTPSPEVTTMPNSDHSDLPPTPTNTAQAAQLATTTALPDQNTQTNSPELKPSNPDQPEGTVAPEDNPDQPEGTVAPEDNPGPQTEQPAQPEPTTSAASAGVEPKDLDPTEIPITTETPKTKESTRGPPTTHDLSITPDSVKQDPSPSKEAEKPTKPKPEAKDVLDEGNPQDYQSDANKDTNLCSELPVNGLTTLRNGTIAVFRGHYFWMLDSRRRPGPAQSITDVWGIPSPIDTVFTRCNCQGKTYFFKGNNYWRFENDVMDPGFPRPVSEGFGLGGQITAALSMPQYRSRKESVFFFKRGGLAQRYSYRVTPQCGRNLAVYTTKKKVKRQAVPELGQEIDIRKSLRGFPYTVSSAISVHSSGGDGYKYYVFSKSKYYSLKMEGDTPVILTPRSGPGQQKPEKSWFRCQKTL